MSKQTVLCILWVELLLATTCDAAKVQKESLIIGEWHIDNKFWKATSSVSLLLERQCKFITVTDRFLSKIINLKSYNLICLKELTSFSIHKSYDDHMISKLFVFCQAVN